MGWIVVILLVVIWYLWSRYQALLKDYKILKEELKKLQAELTEVRGDVKNHLAVFEALSLGNVKEDNTWGRVIPESEIIGTSR